VSIAIDVDAMAVVDDDSVGFGSPAGASRLANLE